MFSGIHVYFVYKTFVHKSDNVGLIFSVSLTGNKKSHTFITIDMYMAILMSEQQ